MKTTIGRLRDYYSSNKEKDKFKLSSNSSLEKVNSSDNLSKKISLDSSDEKLDFSKNQIYYPELSDSSFNVKITNKKEFADNKSYSNDIEKINKIAKEICEQDFQLAPHQIFVRNFMSSLTPYNSLLLYHGLGTGKTCSAIGVAEEMRDYMKKMNIKKKILIIASPNVQENFRLQLFDERKLKKQENGKWNIASCVGKALYKEVDILNNLEDKEVIVYKVNNLINKYYEFMGYTKLSTLITKKKKKNTLKETFEGRLVIIDEVHNIRPSEQAQKKIFDNLNYLVSEVNHIRLLLLSATPMFNNYKEIIDLINVLLKNEKRDILIENEIFDKEGDFVIDEKGEKIGEINFIRKITGLVSFVQGENPFSFPFRIFPKIFAPENSFKHDKVYPKLRLDNTIILTSLEHIDVYPVEISGLQKEFYNKIINNIISKNKLSNDVEEDERLEKTKYGYSVLQEPLESLNIIFPNNNENSSLNEYLGKKGLSRIVANINELPYNFSNEYLNNSNRSMFSLEDIGNYSSKMKTIGNEIQKNDGISLVFSQYIYGGIVPIAIMLEEIGFVRYGNKNNFLSNSYKKNNNVRPFLINGKQATYVMISSNTYFSRDNTNEIKASTGEENIDGSIVKVILITKAGSEGIDLKNIRSIHVLDPLYNMNRIEQIIGRGVRNCSHKNMELKYRNVSVYLYGSYYDETECADLYVYRNAEKKALQIGKVSRVLKSNSVDCLLQINNRSYFDIPKRINIVLANKKKVEYNLSNQSYSSNCDYMKSCAFKCTHVKNNKIEEIDDSILDDMERDDSTYDVSTLDTNIDNLKNKIQNLFYEKYFYTKEELFYRLQTIKHYPQIQILKALEDLSGKNNEDYIYDNYGQEGYIINVDNLYIFQPTSIKSKKIMMYDRIRPVDKKIDYLNLIVDDNLSQPKKDFTSFDFNEMFSDLIRQQHYSVTKEKLFSKLDFKENIIQFIFINHFYDNLNYEIRKTLFLEYIDKEITDTNSNEYILQSIFKKNVITKDNTSLKLYLIHNDSTLIPIIFENNNWTIGNDVYLNEFSQEIKSKFYFDKEKNKSIEQLGLLLPSTKNSYLDLMKDKIDTVFDTIDKISFKIKDMSNYRNKGAICENMKPKARNLVLKYISSKENTDELTQKNSEATCLMIEMIFRYKNETEDLKWFLSCEESIYNKENNKDVKF